MKSLQGRLKDYKIFKKAVEDGEIERGYSVKYNGGEISVRYRELDGHLIVEKGKRTIGIYDLGEEKKVKKRCYRESLKYLRQNTHIELGEIWTHLCYPVKRADGSRIIVKGLPRKAFGIMAGFEDIDNINRRRAERGLEPVSGRV